MPVSKESRPSVSVPPASAPKKTVVLSDRYEEKPPFGTGAFQFYIIMTLSIAVGTFALHSNSFKLTAAVMDHWCRRPALFENLSVAEWKELAIPVDERGKRSRCTVRDPPGAGSAARIVRCTSWEFDLSAHGHNIVSQWSLVCDRRWLIAVAWLVHSVACMASLALAGALGDYIGRRIVVFIALPAMLIAGVASSIPNDFHSFVALRSVVSAAISALVPPLVALVYEVTPMEKMPVYSVASAALLVVASPVALFVTRFFKAGWAAVQLVLMAPACLLLATYYTVDESPAWLLEIGEAKEAERVMLRAAALNHVPLEVTDDLIAQYEQWIVGQHPRQRAEYRGACSARFRARATLLACMWTALGYSYGTCVSSDSVHASDIANLLSHLLSGVACVLAVPSVHQYGFRRVVLVSAFAFSVSSALLLAIDGGDEDSLLLDTLLLMLRVAGNVVITFFFALAIRSYPVIAHCRAVGTGLAWSLLGGIMGGIGPALGSGLSTDLRLSVTAVLMATFAVGVAFLPSEVDWRSQACSTAYSRSSIPSAGELRRTLLESLVPLPKEPVKRRGAQPRPRSLSLPEQYSLRLAEASKSISGD
ncbi:solute carrier family 22 member 7-like [Dermacentor albipictus]|uniref:solute carrier family 22 member 7-like n=1 Tax=Dermacentor albipictus TaxID=60249 RepID=UPI0031FE3FA1